MKLALLITVLLTSICAFAQDVAPQVDKIQPALDFVGYILQFIVTTFPKAGPILQAAVEVIGGIASFFTLATVFVVGALKIPYLAAKWAGAHEIADKVEAFSAKITPYFKYLSIFNVKKK